MSGGGFPSGGDSSSGEGSASIYTGVRGKVVMGKARLYCGSVKMIIHS